jgi:hypothetical protein
LSVYTGRKSQLQDYLGEFNPWEIEELNCIYDHLEALLRGDENLQNQTNLRQPDLFHSMAPGQSSPLDRLTIAKLLSQGLVFLRLYFKITSLRTRAQMEKSLTYYDNKFILQALEVLKNGRRRYPGFDEWIVSSNLCPWPDNYGAHVANTGWMRFSLGGLRSFDNLRRFGFCIWDHQRDSIDGEYYNRIL